jgi:threonine/homoserine/homoserine lactone efflux protein
MAVYGSVAVAAGGAVAGLAARPRLQSAIARGAGAMLVMGALFTAVEGLRGL